MTPGYIIRVCPEGRFLVKMVPEKKHCLKTAHRAVQEKDDPKIKECESDKICNSPLATECAD